MKICPHCDAPNKNKAKFCVNCGRPIQDVRIGKDPYTETGQVPMRPLGDLGKP